MNRSGVAAGVPRRRLDQNQAQGQRQNQAQGQTQGQAQNQAQGQRQNQAQGQAQDSRDAAYWADVDSVVQNSRRAEARLQAEARANMQAQRSTPRRTLDGWSRNAVLEGSPAYEREINRLMAGMDEARFDMVHFADNMAAWADPRSAEAKARQFNRTYCECMLNMCLRPLQNGIDGGSLCDCVGMYVGMAIFSKDFRKACNDKVVDAMMPHMRERAMKCAERWDRLCPVPEGQLSRAELEERKWTERYVKRRSDQLGREFLTPEAAATKYIGFCNQAYQMMRTDTTEMAATREALKDAKEKNLEDRTKRLEEKLEALEQARTEKVMRQFDRASSTLKSVAAMDGISESQFNDNVRTVYGKLVQRHPEMQAVFGETAMDDVSKRYSYRQDPMTGRVTRTWHGEMQNKDGTLYTGCLTPRRPMTQMEASRCVEDYYRDAFDNCKDADDLEQACRGMEMDMAGAYWKKMLRDDMRGAAAVNEPRGSVDSYVNRMFDEAASSAMDQWRDEHTPKPKPKTREQLAAERERREIERERAREEREIARERAREEREAAKDARSAEAHDLNTSKRKAELDLLKQQKLFYQQLAKTMRDPAMQTKIANAIAAGKVVSPDNVAEGMQDEDDGMSL